MPPPREEQIVETLVVSHARIGILVGRAAVIADSSGIGGTRTCGQLARRLTTSLALHVCDHEDSLVPRLRGRGGELDTALVRLVDEHRRQLDLVKRLRVVLDWVRQAPDDLRARNALASIVLPLGYLFIGSFALEERAVFPAVRGRLSPEERRSIAREMRMRRRPSTMPIPARQPNGNIGELEGAAEQP
jgi:hypothetical protein